MNIGNKRKDAMEGDNKPKRAKKECDYGERCYRRNPAHFREFSHKHLEVILDAYTGNGDYPIPDKYILERLTIMEQLDVIVEKDFYTPWKNNTPRATSSNTCTLNAQKVNRCISPTIKDSGGKTSHNNTTGSSNTEVTTNSSKASSSSQISSRNVESNSKVDLTSSSNVESSSKNVGTSNKNVETSSKNIGTSSRNVGSSSRNVEATASNNNSIAKNMDYKKAADYRPIVPPTRRVEDFLTVVLPKNKMAAKHAASAPYHIFYTTITAARETHAQPNSITFLEILDPSLGELKCSLQINFMVELGWLLAQYYFAGYSEKRLTVLYGEESDDLKTITQKKPQVDAHKVVMSSPFGTHHTKMMLLCYEDGTLRVVISTANLYLDDWENRTQGLWFSPACRELPADAMPHDGESPTFFKRSLLRYLAHYQLPALAPYVERVKRCDFSHINVFFVASVPGSHSGVDWGLTRAGSLLRQYAVADRRWPLLAQASSIGSYGNQPRLWLTGDFLHNFTKVKDQPQTLTAPPELKLIYPSLENVSKSHDGLLGGGCLPYGLATHAKQPWLNDFLYQWKATSTHRNRAMPHIKSYTRVSTDNKMASYYLLTSANCSKAAWGSVNKGNGALRIMSYEAGVLLLPQFVNVSKSHDGLLGGGCLPYGLATHAKQPWLNDFLYQWKATSTHRNRAMPHIKSYTRVSTDNKMASYYLLTSANCSKAAWGSVNKGNGALRIMSYEAGVLLLPQFVIKKDHFPLEGENRLILAYDVPPTKYTPDMRAWVMDYLR